MSSGQKAALSLLISVLLFAAFTVAAFAGLFSILETRYYQPAVVSAMESKLSSISQSFNEYSDSHINRFSSFALSLSVKRSSLPSQTAEDIQTREDLSGLLMSETSGLKGIRVIGSDGRKIHYSTFSQDVLRKQQNLINYENYEKLGETPYETLQCTEDQKSRLILDSTNDRLIYSFVFYDAFDILQGTIAFYVESQDFNRYLLMQNLITVSEKSLLLHNKGFVFGIAQIGQELVSEEIGKKWSEGLYGTERLIDAQQFSFLMLSNTNSPKAVIAEVFREELFIFSDAVKIILLVSVFMTLYLSVLLLLNIKQDDTVFIRERIKKFQFALLNEYLETKEEIDWQKVITDIQLRRHEATRDLKKSLGRRGKKHIELVDSLLEKSWDEIFASIRKNIPQSVPQIAQVNTDEIKKMLEEILSTARVQSASVPKTAVKKAVQKPAAPVPSSLPDTPDELEELDEVEAVEDLDEVEAVEELDEVEEAEELDEVEAVEDLDEVEEAEELDEVEEAEELDEVEAVEDLDEVEAVEELDEVEEAEELDEVEAVEDLDEVEAVEELDEVEEAEELDEVEEAEELDEVEEVEELDEAEEAGKPAEEDVTVHKGFDVHYEEADDSFSVSESAIFRSVLAEELTFGDLTLTEKESSHEDTKIHFEIAFPDFSDLDKEEQIKAEPKKNEHPSVSLDNSKITDNSFEDYEELDKAEIVDLINDASPFTFAMQFASPPQVTELTSAEEETEESIIEKDGLFTIPREIKQKEIPIDKDFMNLVDSVLK